MTKRSPINTDEDLVVAIANVFDHLESPTTPDEIDATLREAGHEPEEVGIKLENFVDEIIRNERSALWEDDERRIKSFKARGG